jgi:hypothetical protein
MASLTAVQMRAEPKAKVPSSCDKPGTDRRTFPLAAAGHASCSEPQSGMITKSWTGSQELANRQRSYPGTKLGAGLYSAMQWIEALINVSAFAGFLGVASCWPNAPSK